MAKKSDLAVGQVRELFSARSWSYTGYHGGGGGSRFRTLTFVRYLDEEPTPEQVAEARS